MTRRSRVRPTDDHAAIRRRRYCPACGARWTTFERVHLRELTVVKKNRRAGASDGADELFRSLRIALRKRPVDDDRIERIVNSIPAPAGDPGELEIPSKVIGEMAVDSSRSSIRSLRSFASVYRNFREAKDFEEFVESLRRPFSIASSGAGPVPTADDGEFMRTALARPPRPRQRLAEPGGRLRCWCATAASSAAAETRRAAGHTPRQKRSAAPAISPWGHRLCHAGEPCAHHGARPGPVPKRWS